VRESYTFRLAEYTHHSNSSPSLHFKPTAAPKQSPRLSPQGSIELNLNRDLKSGKTGPR